MDEEKKGFNVEFLTSIFSPPCVILAEIAGIYLTINYNHHGIMPDAFIPWVLFILECAFMALGMLILVFIVMLLALLIVGGIAPNISEKFVGIFLEIIVFILAIVYLPSLL